MLMIVCIVKEQKTAAQIRAALGLRAIHRSDSQMKDILWHSFYLYLVLYMFYCLS